MTEAWPPSMLLPTVSVYADGQWVADGRNPDTDEPQVLDGLTVRWGRSTVVDQPQPSTCTLTLFDHAGGSRFLDQIRVGGRLDVLADAVIGTAPDPDDPDAQKVIDESFEAGPGLTYLLAGAASLTVQPGGTAGIHHLRVDTLGTQAVTVAWPPAPREPVGGNPAAWDGVPRSLSGETWYAAVDVHLPSPFAGWQAWAVEVTPITYDSPWDSPGRLGPLLTSTDLGDGWVRVAGSFVPPPNVWLGVAIRLWPVAPAWDELNEVAWDDLRSVDDETEWDQLGRFGVDQVQLIAPAAGASRLGMVFSGRVSDMEARYDDLAAATLVDVTAADQRAELGNRDVGDQPWPLESLGTRFARIISLSGQPIESRVSPAAAALPVSWRDVDRQPAMTLLSELATSADGVLWAATHPTTGPYLLLESLADRPALFVLHQDDDRIVRITVRPQDETGAMEIDACDILLEPIRWRHDVNDMATRVAVTWREQTTDEQTGQPKPTDRTVTVINPLLEGDIGVHRIAVGTQLADGDDAQVIADAILGRTGNTEWLVSGLEWRADTTDQLDGDALTRIMTLLDGTTRNGLPILLTGVPAWSPVPQDTVVPLYLEGGVYESIDGSWRLSLIVSAANATGMSAAWDELPGGTLQRTNRGTNPRAVSGGAAQWAQAGWGTGGAGTTGYITGVTAPAGTNVSTAWRKTWTTAATSATAAAFSIVADANNRMAVTAGKTYTVSVFVRHNGIGTKNYEILLRWFNQVANSGSAQVGADLTSATVAVADGVSWTRLSFTVTAPAGAASMGVYPRLTVASSGAIPVGATQDITGLLVEEAAGPVGAYFDGDSQDVAGVTDFAWTGAANASTSTQSDMSTGWQWDQFDPAITWNDLGGVAAPTP